MHLFHPCQRFHSHPFGANPFAARLERLLHSDTGTNNRGPCLLHQIDQPFQRGAVGQKIVNDEHAILRIQIGLCHDDMVDNTVGKGGHLSGVELPAQVSGLALFGKDHRTVEILGGYADPGRFDGEDLVHPFVLEQTIPLLSHLVEQFDVHLVVQKAVHLQDILI